MLARCDACGLPPLPNHRLLKCTRCNQAQYHDRRCQQNHYPTHKAECRRIARAAAAAKKTGADSPPSAPPRLAPAPVREPSSRVECRSIDGRGRSIFATTPLAVGSRPLCPSKDGDGSCEPVVDPVLLESMRDSRCALCFRPTVGRTTSPSPPASASFHRHCSAECRRLDGNWIAETRAARRLPSPPSPTALSCSRILRRFISSPSARKEYDELCHCDVDSLSKREKEAYASIVTQCHAFLLAMDDAATANMARDLLHPDPTPAHAFVSRMSRNGFTVSTSEQLPIGHGVYCGPSSAINHSCRPNAVPTFRLRGGRPPALRITTCRSVGAGEEVTIAYCDASSPRRVRREGLRTNYGFDCDCPLCEDAERDDDVVGLRCTATEGCEGRVRSMVARPIEENDCTTAAGKASSEEGARWNESKYRCATCGNTDFDEALGVQADSMIQMKEFESTMNDDSNGRRYHKSSGKAALQIYESLKRHCDPKRSYYVAWSADLFSSWCANALNSCADEREQLELCRRALVVASESRSASKFCAEYPGNVSWHVRRGTEAKLRLFANPMDMEALGMLRNVREELLVYYPSSDDTICSLEESLAAYSFS